MVRRRSPFLLFLILRLISPAYTYRKEGHVKIVEYDLAARQKNQLTRKRADVLQAEKADSFSKLANGKTATVDEDTEMGSGDENDDEGEDVLSDAGGQSPSLPKAVSGRVKTKRGRNERVIPPEECRAHLRRLFYNEAVMCSLIFGRHGPFAPLASDRNFSIASADIFFMDVLLVPPTRFRPPTKMGDTVFEHPQNELLGRVLQTTYKLRDLNVDLHRVSEKKPGHDDATRKSVLSALLATLIQLQTDVNSFMDSNKNPQIVRQGKLPPAGVKQGLEKKEGLFRKHMMVSIMLSLKHQHLMCFIGQACKLFCAFCYLT